MAVSQMKLVIRKKSAEMRHPMRIPAIQRKLST